MRLASFAPNDRIAVAFIAAFGAASTAWALFAGRYLPCIDLSNHLALISALAHGGSTGADAYVTRVIGPSPYLLFYATTALLAQAMPVDVAAKVVVAAAGGAFALSSAALARATGRDPKLSVLAPLAVFGLSYGWGFTSFVVASPCFVFALAAHEELLVPRERIDRRVLLKYAAWVLIVFNAHGLLALALAALVGARATSISIIDFVRSRKISKLAPFALALGGSLPAALSMLPLAIERFTDPWKEEGTREEDQRLFIFEPLAKHLDNLGGNLLERGSVDHWKIMWGACAWLALAVLLAIVEHFRQRRAFPRSEVRAHRAFGLETYALGLLAIYFVGPITVGAPVSAWLVYPRFAVLAGVALSLLPRVTVRGLAAWVLIPIGLLLVGANAELNARHTREFSSLATKYDGVRKLIPPKSRVLALTVGVPRDDFTNQQQALGSLYFYHMVDGASVVAYLFEMPVLPARVRMDRKPRAPFWKTPHEYDPKIHGVEFDYLVLRGPGLVARTRAANLHELVADVEGWTVWKTKSPTKRPDP
ncbi:MAG: hypothetical protein HYV07_00420 [Deltaproteobacteria bacterium]|nr:hypothetical protein [Deltaproteobacteria bacterium]